MIACEKNYEEALSRARNIYCASESKDVLDTLTTIFPELKKSEDKVMFETITKGLNELVNDFGWSDFGGIPIDNILVWLEKQCKQKPANKVKPKFHTAWSKEDERMFMIIITLMHFDAYRNNRVDKNGKDLDIFADIKKWLYSVRDRLQHQTNCV